MGDARVSRVRGEKSPVKVAVSQRLDAHKFAKKSSRDRAPASDLQYSVAHAVGRLATG